MKKLAVLFLFILPFITKAINYTSVANGNWSSSATWSPAGVPGSGDNVTIATTVAVNATESVNNITINSGSTLTSNSTTLNIAGNFINNGTYTATGIAIIKFNGTAN